MVLALAGVRGIGGWGNAGWSGKNVRIGPIHEEELERRAEMGERRDDVDVCTGIEKDGRGYKARKGWTFTMIRYPQVIDASILSLHARSEQEQR
jgi:hypothetical protein